MQKLSIINSYNIKGTLIRRTAPDLFQNVALNHVYYSLNRVMGMQFIDYSVFLQKTQE